MEPGSHANILLTLVAYPRSFRYNNVVVDHMMMIIFEAHLNEGNRSDICTKCRRYLNTYSYSLTVGKKLGRNF